MTHCMRFLNCILIAFSINLQAEQPTISFTVATAEVPPYVFLDENNQIKGKIIDLLNQVQMIAALKIDIYVMPWGRALHEVKENRIDAIMPAQWSEERATYLEYPQKSFYSLDESIIIKRSEDDFEFTKLSDIPKNKLIGKTRLAMINSTFDKLAEEDKLSIYETPKLDQALLMLAQEKISFVVSESGIALSTIKSLGLEGQFTTYPLVMDRLPSYMAFSRAFAEVHDINSIMEIIIQNKPAGQQRPANE